MERGKFKEKKKYRSSPCLRSVHEICGTASYWGSSIERDSEKRNRQTWMGSAMRTSVPFTPAHQREQPVFLAARLYHPDTHTPRSHSHHIPSRASGNSIPLLHLRNKQIPSHSRRFHFHHFVRLYCRQRCHWHQGAPR